jgi:hypothetical protein
MSKYRELVESFPVHRSPRDRREAAAGVAEAPDAGDGDVH